MRMIFILFFVILLAGCSRQIEIEDYSLEEKYNNGTVVHELNFTLYNPSGSVADCNATLHLSNGAGTAEKSYGLGEIEPGSKKAKSIRFIMPEGEIALNLTTDCSFE